MPFEKIDLVVEELIIRQSRNLLIKYPNFQKFLLYVKAYQKKLKLPLIMCVLVRVPKNRNEKKKKFRKI